MTLKLPELRRELEQLAQQELVKLCLRIAKYKVENKELLGYLLVESDDPLFYAEKIKPELIAPFQEFSTTYHLTKSIRKSTRLITKYYRFTGSRQGETELLLHLVEGFHSHFRWEFRTQAFARILFRSLKKADTNLLKLHEDLQADYREILRGLVFKTESRFGSAFRGEEKFNSLE
jgi:hypothetical protein